MFDKLEDLVIRLEEVLNQLSEPAYERAERTYPHCGGLQGV